MRSTRGLIVVGLSSLLLVPSAAWATSGYDTGWGGDTATPDQTEGGTVGGTEGGANEESGGGTAVGTTETPGSDSGTTGDEDATEGDPDDMNGGELTGRGCTIGTRSPGSGLMPLVVLGLLGLRRRRRG